MSRHIAIIGAGAVGVMSAIQCLAAGLRVTLIDRGEPGGEQAASYGNAGWLSSQSVLPPAEPGVWRKIPGFLADPLGPLAIRPLYSPRIAPWLWRYMTAAATPARVERIATQLRTLLKDAATLHRQVADEAGLAPLLRADSGLMHVYRSRAAFLAEAASWRIRRHEGIEWRELNDAELRAAQPDLSPLYRFAVVVPEGGHCVDPGAYIAGLARHAVARGAQRLTAQALGLRFDGTRLGAVLHSRGELACDGAVIAAGAQSRTLARDAGNDTSLETERGYHVEHLAPNAGPRLPVMVGDRKLIVTRMGDRLRIAGQVELAGLAAAPDWRRAAVLKTLLHQLFPTLRHDDAAAYRQWLGHRPSSPDGKPYIGICARSPDVVLAFGHGHIGLGSSARTGRLVRQLLIGEPPEIDLQPFSPDRS